MKKQLLSIFAGLMLLVGCAFTQATVTKAPCDPELVKIRDYTRELACVGETYVSEAGDKYFNVGQVKSEMYPIMAIFWDRDGDCVPEIGNVYQKIAEPNVWQLAGPAEPNKLLFQITEAGEAHLIVWAECYESKNI